MFMGELRGVQTPSSYGCVRIRLKELMRQRGLTRYRLARLADTRFEVVEKWCSGTVERIDADVLARFCYVLECEVEDILQYER